MLITRDFITTRNWAFDSAGFTSRKQSFRSLDNGGAEINLDIPGINPDDIDVEVAPELLNISSKGKVLRSYELAETVDVDAITANAEFGVLKIQVPVKAKDAPRKIPVPFKGRRTPTPFKGHGLLRTACLPVSPPERNSGHSRRRYGLFATGVEPVLFDSISNALPLSNACVYRRCECP